MNDIAAPILLVFIAHKLQLRVHELDSLSESPTLELNEKLLLEVSLTSQKQIVIFALLTSCLV